MLTYADIRSIDPDGDVLKISTEDQFEEMKHTYLGSGTHADVC
jgi:hypothetical protein